MNKEKAAEAYQQSEASTGEEFEAVLDDEVDNEEATEIVPEEPPQESNKQRAKRLRKLSEDELFAMEDAAKAHSEMKDLALRKQAEFDNFQKRTEAKRLQDVKFASTALVRSMLGPIDNLDRAVAEAQKSEDFAGLKTGVELTYQQLLEALKKHGVDMIAPVNDPFDPEFHEAVMTGADDSLENDVVLDTFEKGWKLHDRVLRPAKVRVNKLD